MVKAFKINMSSKTKKFLIEWWSMGAIYFFIGFGSLAAYSDALDLIFFLGVTIGVVKTYLIPKFIDEINPYEKKTKTSLFRLSKNTLMGLVLTVAVIYTYDFINSRLVDVLNLSSGKVIVYPEPILFGLLYICYESILKRLLKNKTY